MISQRHGGGPMAAVVYCFCAVYLYAVGSLLAWVALPTVTGLTPTLIISDSMAPRISAGDLVLIGDRPDGPVSVGDVVTFRDPAKPQRLLTHRVAGINADGTIRTRGDANAQTDSSAVPAAGVIGVGRVLVPAVGVPLMWVRMQAWVQLLVWLGGTALALHYVRTFGRRLPRLVSWTTSLNGPPRRPSPAADVATSTAPQWESPAPVRPRLRWATASGIVVVVALVAVVVPRAVSSEAAFAARTKSANNQLGAATTFCTSPGAETVTANADAKLEEFRATRNYGSTTDLTVVSQLGKDQHSLVSFPLPTSRSGCAISATLRLYVATPAAGRVVEALQVAGTWAEGTVTWATAPATTGAAASAPSLSAAGWLDIDVSPQVQNMYAATNHGFLVRDSIPDAANPGFTQAMSSRTGTNPPQLVVNFGSSASRPAAPSALTATASSATRIALAWTDNGVDETSYTVQRSLAGAGDWSVVATLSADATSHADTGLQGATGYDYRVRATNAQGDSAWSNVASTTTAAPATTPPTAPSALSATPFSVSRIDLTWTDNSSDEEGFVIQRSPAGAGTWTQVGTVGPGVTSFASTGLTANTAYDFRVAATNDIGTSAFTDVATATTAACSTLSAQTLVSEGDSLILQGAYKDTNFGADGTNFGVRSLSADNGRSLVRFPAPTLAGGCPVTGATLRVYEGSGAVGRTLQAIAITTSWSESTVTWTTQPATTGTPATTTSALGWNAFDVRSLVGSSGTSAPHGFLLRDAVEDAATAATHYLSPREGANPPQLVITFG